MNLVNQFKNIIKQQRLVRTGDHVLVGISGGPDSVVLLHLLLAIRHELGIKISAAHINHGLRPSANKDEKFVQNLCRDFNITCFSKRIALLKSKHKTSIEEVAREQRLSALQKIASRAKANAIALGHNQDDLAETVLMRIIRGTGLMGLKSIIPKRKINNVVIIRPLLEIRRNQIETYLRQRKLRHRTDPTNRKKKFFRNKIRLELLPILEKRYNKNMKGVLCNLANTSTADYDFLYDSAQKKINRLSRYSRNKRSIKLPLLRLRKQSPAMKRMLIRLAIERIAGNTRSLTLAHVRSIEEMVNHNAHESRMNLPKHINVQKTPSAIVITQRN